MPCSKLQASLEHYNGTMKIADVSINFYALNTAGEYGGAALWVIRSQKASASESVRVHRARDKLPTLRIFYECPTSMTSCWRYRHRISIRKFFSLFWTVFLVIAMSQAYHSKTNRRLATPASF